VFPERRTSLIRRRLRHQKGITKEYLNSVLLPYLLLIGEKTTERAASLGGKHYFSGKTPAHPITVLNSSHQAGSTYIRWWAASERHRKGKPAARPEPSSARLSSRPPIWPGKGAPLATKSDYRGHIGTGTRRDPANNYTRPVEGGPHSPPRRESRGKCCPS